MKDLKLAELLEMLSSIAPEKWEWSGGCWQTNINGEKVEIMGDTDFGSSYFIDISGKRVYKSDLDWFPFIHKADKKLDAICDKIHGYYHTNYKKESATAIEKVLI